VLSAASARLTSEPARADLLEPSFGLSGKATSTSICGQAMIAGSPPGHGGKRRFALACYHDLHATRLESPEAAAQTPQSWIHALIPRANGPRP